MIEELIARLRGADKWPETLATVTSVSVYEKQVNRYGMTQAADVTFFYRDGKNELQSGCYTVENDSSLFSVVENDTFSLHYNPRKPDRFWSDAYGFPGSQKRKEVLFIFVAVAGALSILTYLTRK